MARIPNFKHWHNRSGLRGTELARLAGVSDETVTKMRYSRSVTTHTANRVANALNKQLMELGLIEEPLKVEDDEEEPTLQYASYLS